MAITAGGSLNSVPNPIQQALSTNYIDFTDGGTGWEQQYLPDLMEKEAEVFGNRTISGFLSQVGAEEAMTSDQVIWSEQGRLHISLIGTIIVAGSTNGTFTLIPPALISPLCCCRGSILMFLDLATLSFKASALPCS